MTLKNQLGFWFEVFLAIQWDNTWLLTLQHLEDEKYLDFLIVSLFCSVSYFIKAFYPKPKIKVGVFMSLVRKRGLEIQHPTIYY